MDDYPGKGEIADSEERFQLFSFFDQIGNGFDAVPVGAVESFQQFRSGMPFCEPAGRAFSGKGGGGLKKVAEKGEKRGDKNPEPG